MWKVLQRVEWDMEHSSWGQSKDVGCGEASCSVSKQD